MKSLKRTISCFSKQSKANSIAISQSSEPKPKHRRNASLQSQKHWQVTIEHEKIKIEIKIPVAQVSAKSIGWLIEASLLQLQKKVKPTKFTQEFSNVVTFATKNEDINVDYFLTMPHLPLSLIKNGTVLRPYFAQRTGHKESKPTLKDFDFISVLGKGGFSTVYLVRMKINGQFYALKQIAKGDGRLEFYKHRKCALREKTNMMKLKSSFMVRMHFAFQTQKSFYFVMDYVPSGDLLQKLKERVVLDEETAKFYIAEILLGIQYLHANNIIYRDIKPENILLDIDGHVCFADFGLSKEFKSRKEMHFSFSGTPDYMAPEIMVGLGYNYMADFYSVGALAYEFIYGVPPFQLEGDKNEFYDHVMNDKPNYPGYASADFISFVDGLLDKRPPQRLGANGIQEIMSHPWLASIDFKALERRQLQPPIEVNISDLYLQRKIFQPEGDIEVKFEMDISKTTNEYRVSNFSHYSLSELKLIGKDQGDCPFSADKAILRDSDVVFKSDQSSQAVDIKDKKLVITSVEFKDPEVRQHSLLCSGSGHKCKEIGELLNNKEGNFDEKPDNSSQQIPYETRPVKTIAVDSKTPRKTAASLTQFSVSLELKETSPSSAII